MHVLITGGGGFLGQKLAKALARRGQIRSEPITEMTLLDLAAPAAPEAEFPVHSLAGDISEAETVAKALAPKPEVIFHLAAVVSGAAEADFDLGMAVNLRGSLNIFEAVRQLGHRPIVVYASSVAVHGGEAPSTVVDGIELNPQTSYGTQKAMGELLLNDMTRKGFFDGRGLRLPTISIRPGKANAAASSFMSSIFREPLQGERSSCPVEPDYEVWHCPPRVVTENIIHAAEVAAEAFGPNRNINLPGRTDTIGEMVAAMTRVAGPDTAELIDWTPDPVIERIVMGWRNRLQPAKAARLGFKTPMSFEDSVRWFLADDHRDAPR